MPADWEEIEGAEAEGVEIIPQAIPIKIHGENGKVKAVEYLKAEMVPDPKGGRPRPQPIEGSNTIIECSSVFAAIGQQGDYSFIEESKFKDAIKIERGRFVVNEMQQTTLEKVFAGGDAVNRTADAISAIADGYRAVKGIEKFLMGKNK